MSQLPSTISNGGLQIGLGGSWSRREGEQGLPLQVHWPGRRMKRRRRRRPGGSPAAAVSVASSGAQANGPAAAVLVPPRDGSTIPRARSEDHRLSCLLYTSPSPRD